MNEKQDIVIGCISGYDWEHIKYWVNSLDRCGFTGVKALLVYNGSFELVKKIESMGITGVVFNVDEAAQRYTFPISGPEIVVTRFFHQWLFLSQLKIEDYRYVIATDVKDVVFQTNPSDWLSATRGDKRLVVASERLPYKDEAWGHKNMADAFGAYFQAHMADKIIYNAGTMAGEISMFKDFCLNVFLFSQDKKIHNPDQAAVNILLSLEPYKSMTLFDSTNWACQIGTQDDPSKKYENDPPWYDVDYDVLVDNPVDRNPYCIVHQYERNVDWKHRIQEKYS